MDEVEEKLEQQKEEVTEFLQRIFAGGVDLLREKSQEEANFWYANTLAMIQSGLICAVMDCEKIPSDPKIRQELVSKYTDPILTKLHDDMREEARKLKFRLN